MCRNVSEICIGNNDAYDCCEGLSCIGGDPNLPGSAGVCTSVGHQQPIQGTTPPADKCRKTHQFCQFYGPVSCCKGLHCVVLQNLPPGGGVCEPI